jgi:hypothetical protein
MNIAHKLIEDKNNLAIEIDNLFYDIKNIEQQASALRTIVKAFDVETMEIVKGFLTQEVKDQKNYMKGGK